MNRKNKTTDQPISEIDQPRRINDDFRSQLTSHKLLIEQLKADLADRKQAEEALKRHDLRSQVLLKLNKMRAASKEQILDFVRKEIIDITQSEFAFLGFLDEDELTMTIESWSKGAMAKCAVTDKPMHFPISTAGIWAEAVRQRKPVFINDCASPYPAKRGFPKGHVPIKRFMCVPVFVQIVFVRPLSFRQKAYYLCQYRIAGSLTMTSGVSTAG